MQTIRVEVINVIEPPTFLNQPKPYLAVVPPCEVPIGYQVYRVLKKILEIKIIF